MISLDPLRAEEAGINLGPVTSLRCQRWLLGKAIWRRDHPGDRFQPKAHDVVELLDDARPKAFVQTHHYSGSYPASRWRFGLFCRGELVGVAVFSHPSNDLALTNWFPGWAPRAPATSVELGRLVLLDEVAADGESWFVARAFHALRAKRLEDKHRPGVRHPIAGVLSCSDDTPRTTVDGRVVFPGHVGTVYQALGATIAGRTGPSTLRLLPDGTVFSQTARSKILALRQGWQYSTRQLVAFGADPLREGDDPRAWLHRWLPRLTRPLRHRGNHRYLWAFTPAAKGTIAAGLDRLRSGGKVVSLAYPKRVALPRAA